MTSYSKGEEKNCPEQNWPNFGGFQELGQVVQKVSIFTPKGTSFSRDDRLRDLTSRGLAEKKQKVTEPPIEMMCRG